MYKVYGMRTSGNCYKVKLLLEQLGESYEWEEIPSTRIQPRTKGFFAINPNGKVPVLRLADGRHLPESNAILCYLAEGTPYLPQDRFDRAQVLQWLFFEQNNHEPSVAEARFIKRYYQDSDSRWLELPTLHERGYRALGVMEQALARQPYLAGDAFTIADISLFAYTHVAHEGGYDLTPYPAINSWLDRVKGQPGFTPLG
ncbi:MAG: glutathione S-transferase family protein [Candidatus Marinimicrobia bacterium]|nr:glutathione S-transferase family protein [Candidatus Neomarinimicrobiota bacterium]